MAFEREIVRFSRARHIMPVDVHTFARCSEMLEHDIGACVCNIHCLL